MKIRNGFVSNSSSSSFVVKVYDEFDAMSDNGQGKEYVPPVTNEEVARLKEYGFKLAAGNLHASDIQAGLTPKARSKYPTKSKYLWRSVICNQDEVIEFLTKNNIPFEASCHYGHESVFFERDAKEYVTIRNLGLEYETYRGCGSVRELIGRDGHCIRKDPINENS